MNYDAFRRVACRREVYDCREIVTKQRAEVSFLTFFVPPCTSTSTVLLLQQQLLLLPAATTTTIAAPLDTQVCPVS